MDEFKIKVNDYLEDIVKSSAFKSMTLERYYEFYVDTYYSFQCTVFLKGSLKVVFTFFLAKGDNEKLVVNKVTLTTKETEILASI